MKKSIPFMIFRGGSSKGVYLKRSDLPLDEKERNEVILKIMEGTLEGDPRQIDGLGGANSLTSKVAIVSPSEVPDCDLDYYFLQVVVGEGRVSTTQTCGNILAGVLPFAIESGMLKANSPTTIAKINILNTGGICECIVQTPENQVKYVGNSKIDGVVGTAAPIICNYLETVGSTCGALLPTGNSIDNIEGINATCIDNGMPLVLMLASDFGIIGNESKENLESNLELKKKIEMIRISAGQKMNLGDVTKQTIPKMCLVSHARNGGTINTRMFIPHVVHQAIGVLAAVSVATACLIGGTVCHTFFEKSKEKSKKNYKDLSIEHPSGEFTVRLDYETNELETKILKSGVIRTAKFIAEGKTYIY
ncbi:MAG: 4-oxalomesaconate tautomerase [Leadbetterella sp.]|nr:4-oxalomesaconate tautomerase [Leadbetterella sp.]